MKTSNPILFYAEYGDMRKIVANRLGNYRDDPEHRKQYEKWEDRIRFERPTVYRHMLLLWIMKPGEFPTPVFSRHVGLATKAKIEKMRMREEQLTRYLGYNSAPLLRGPRWR